MHSQEADRRALAMSMVDMNNGKCKPSDTSNLTQSSFKRNVIFP